jgi:hypothetical protein
MPKYFCRFARVERIPNVPFGMDLESSVVRALFSIIIGVFVFLWSHPLT